MSQQTLPIEIGAETPDITQSALDFTQIKISELDVLAEKTDAIIDRTSQPYQQGTYKHATPVDNIKPIGEILGGFDLDPCASGNSVLAETNIREDGGLLYDWSQHDTIYVNPPYSRNEVSKWLKKAINTDAKTVVMLLRSDPSTDWHQELAAPNADLIYYPDDRIEFGTQNGNGGFASVFFIFGEYPAELQHYCENNGWVPTPTPKTNTIQVTEPETTDMLAEAGVEDRIQIFLSKTPDRNKINSTCVEITPICKNTLTHTNDSPLIFPNGAELTDGKAGQYREITGIYQSDNGGEVFCTIIQSTLAPTTMYCFFSDEQNVLFDRMKIDSIRIPTDYEQTTTYVPTPS